MGDCLKAWKGFGEKKRIVTKRVKTRQKIKTMNSKSSHYYFYHACLNGKTFVYNREAIHTKWKKNWLMLQLQGLPSPNWRRCGKGGGGLRWNSGARKKISYRCISWIPEPIKQCLCRHANCITLCFICKT